MSPDIKTAYLNAMLQRFRTLINQDHYVFNADRRDNKNRDTMVLLQYTNQDVINEFLSLDRSHYRQGPIQDKDSPDKELWVFKKKVDGYEIYMKIKHIKSKDVCIIVSFHVNEIE